VIKLLKAKLPKRYRQGWIEESSIFEALVDLGDEIDQALDAMERQDYE
jgi:hypothetical protein